MYKYVLLDLDGTLIDPKEGITKSAACALEKQGIVVKNPDELLGFIGPPLRESFPKYYNLNPEQTEQAVRDYREEFQRAGMYQNKLYPTAMHLLVRLKNSGATVALATSKPEEYALEILKNHGIFRYFKVVCGASMDASRDTKAAVIEEAWRRLQKPDKQSVVMVGDRYHDVEGAKANGIDCIGVTFGYGSRKELLDAGAVSVAADFEQLFSLLTKEG